MFFFNSLGPGPRKSRGIEYVAQKLSSLQTTHGKERTHRDDSLFLWQVYLEGLAAPRQDLWQQRQPASSVAPTLTVKMAK